MANRLPVTLDFGTLPQTDQGYTPQQFANILGTNGAIFTEQEFALFVTGSTAPTSDVGPWLANGNEWRVWDDNVGAYVPITIDQQSLGYIISDSAPDPADYQFWIKVDAGGSPLGLFTYYNGAWTDVYASSLTGYVTLAAFNAALALKAPLISPVFVGTPQAPTPAPGTNDTSLATTAFVQNAIGSIPGALNPAPGVGRLNVAQAILADGSDTLMTIDSAPVNPDGAISIGDNAYVALATGIYHIDVWTQFDNAGATASGVEVDIGLYVNGVSTNQGDTDGTPSPNGSRWSPGFGAVLSLAAGDKVTCHAVVGDGVGVGNVNLTTWEIAGYRVK